MVMNFPYRGSGTCGNCNSQPVTLTKLPDIRTLCYELGVGWQEGWQWKMRGGGSPHLPAFGTQEKSLRLQIAFKGLLGTDKTWGNRVKRARCCQHRPPLHPTYSCLTPAPTDSARPYFLAKEKSVTSNRKQVGAFTEPRAKQTFASIYQKPWQTF